MGQLSPCARTTEPLSPRACAVQQDKTLQGEAHAPQLESSPHSLQLEKAHMQQRRCNAAKKFINFFKSMIVGTLTHSSPETGCLPGPFAWVSASILSSHAF